MSPLVSVPAHLVRCRIVPLSWVFADRVSRLVPLRSVPFHAAQ